MLSTNAQGRFALRDAIPLDVVFLRPAQDGAEVSWAPSSLTTKSSLPRSPSNIVSSGAAQAPGSDVSAAGTKTCPAEIVNHRQNAEAPTGNKGVGDKVEAPALVRLLRHRHLRARRAPAYGRHAGAPPALPRGGSAAPSCACAPPPVRRRFSSPGNFRRRASDNSRPPYFASHLSEGPVPDPVLSPYVGRLRPGFLSLYDRGDMLA